MNTPHSRTIRIASSLVAASCALLLTACGGETPETNVKVVGNATPAGSPASASPAGEVLDFPAIRDMERVGETIALRLNDALVIGTLPALRDGSAVRLDIENTCGDLGASTAFTLPCGDRVYVIDPLKPTLDDARPTTEPATVAALMTDGTLLTAQADSDMMHVGGRPLQVADGSDQLVWVPGDTVVRLHRYNSTVQDIQWRDPQQGGTLRAGQGIGNIAPGEHSLLVGADTVGGQLLIFTTDDIVMMHQSTPVGPSPWGVAWDPARQLAWVTTTGDNQAQGYSIATGEPVRQASFPTVADAHNMSVLADGTLLVASASGDGLQVVNL